MHKEKVEPRVFHIHYDGKWISKELFEKLTHDHGFMSSNFSGCPKDSPKFIPEVHLTFKTPKKEEFKIVWDTIIGITSNKNFKGYIEGEYLPRDEFIPWKKFSPKPIPFKIDTRKLDPKKGEVFRQTELHLALNTDTSEPKLIKDLIGCGLFGGNIAKERGNFTVLTAQGYIRDINSLYTQLLDYITSVGGAKDCTIKEERIVKFKLFDTKTSSLPHIVDNILEV